MIAGVAIRVQSDTATPALRDMLAGLTPARVAARIGPPLQTLTMEHLAGLGSNVKGWPSTGFYEKFARNVRWMPDAGGVAIAILPAVIQGRVVGLRLRVFGGTIQPTTVQMLAIPISPVSYSKVPSDFSDLFLLRTARGAYLCQRGQQISEKTGRVIGRLGSGGRAGYKLHAEIRFLFKLQASVTQAGNRAVLPSDDDLLVAAMEAAGNYQN